MLRPSHRAALRATARVAMLGSLGGCPSAERIAECEDLYDASLDESDTGSYPELTPEAAADAEVADCCDILAKQDPSKYSACCHSDVALSESARQACSPWGPPMPPEMLA